MPNKKEKKMGRNQFGILFAMLMILGAGTASAAEKQLGCDLSKTAQVAIEQTEPKIRIYRVTVDGKTVFRNIPPVGCSLQQKKPGTYFFPLHNFASQFYAKNALEPRTVGHEVESITEFLSQELGVYSVQKDEFESWDDFWNRNSLATSKRRPQIQATTYAVTFNLRNIGSPAITYNYDPETQTFSGIVNAIDHCYDRSRNDEIFTKHQDIKAICDAGTISLLLARDAPADVETFFSLPAMKVESAKARSLAENLSVLVHGHLVQPYMLGRKPLLKVEGFLISDFETGEVFYRKDLTASDEAASPAVAGP